MAKIEDPEKRRLAKDKDLMTPRHDEILMWLFQNAGAAISAGLSWDDDRGEDYVEEITGAAYKKAQKVLNELRSGLADYGLKKRGHYRPCVPHDEREVAWLKKQIAFYEKYENNFDAFKNDLGTVPEHPGYKVSGIKVQAPIYARSGNRRGAEIQNAKISGFMDMIAAVSYPQLHVSGIVSGFRNNTANWIEPKFGFEICRGETSTWYFDVRTSVDNLGTLAREIEILKNALSDDHGNFRGEYAVVAPQTELSWEILDSQNVIPVQYDPNLKSEDKTENQDFWDPLSTARFREDDYDYEILPYPSLGDEDDEEDAGWSVSYDLPVGRE